MDADLNDVPFKFVVFDRLTMKLTVKADLKNKDRF